MGIPLVGNWSEMQPTSRRLYVLRVGLDRDPFFSFPEYLP
jgi:hypothetical protein